MPPSLINAYKRVDWGRERLQELKLLHDAICKANAKAIVHDHYPEITIAPGDFSPRIARVNVDAFVQVPDSAFRLTSEAALHFRAALDYLIANLSELDTPNTVGKKRRTQFPIEDLESRFRGQRPTHLEGVTDAHVAKIEALQPYNGCQWTGLLRDLSNRDKHADLVIVENALLAHLDSHPEAPADGQPPVINMTVQFEPVLQTVLRDGAPLVQTLEIVESQITQLLEAFNPEF